MQIKVKYAKESNLQFCEVSIILKNFILKKKQQQQLMTAFVFPSKYVVQNLVLSFVTQ